MSGGLPPAVAISVLVRMSVTATIFDEGAILRAVVVVDHRCNRVLLEPRPLLPVDDVNAPIAFAPRRPRRNEPRREESEQREQAWRSGHHPPAQM